MSRTRIARRLTALLAAASLAPALQAQTVRVFGFDAAPIDQAQLSLDQTPDGKLALKISNLGSSGCDGVSIAPPPPEGADSLEVTCEPTDPALPIQQFTFTAQGEIAGNPLPLNQASIIHRDDPLLFDHWSLTLDASFLGGSAHDLRLFDEASEVGALLLPDGDELLLRAHPETVRVAADGSLSLAWHDAQEVIGVLSGGQLTPLDLSVTDIRCTTDGLVPQGTLLTALYVQCADTGDLLVSGASLGVAGAHATGTDLALLEKKGGKLKISNLGSSGCDGVSIAPGGGLGSGASAAGGELLLTPPGANGPLGAGALLQASLAAQVQGSLHEQFAGLTLTRVAPGTPDRLDFGCDPDMVLTTWFYECRLGGQLVASGDPTALQIALVDSAFETLDGITFGTATAGGAEQGLALHFAQPVVASFDGQAVQADEIRLLLPAGEAWRVSDCAALTVECDGIPSLEVASVHAEATPFANMGYGHGFRGHVTILKNHLSGGGPMTGGSASAVMLHDAPPSEPAGLFLSTASLPTPFKGGTLITLPIVSLIFLGTDASGGLDIPFVWPQGLPAGLDVFAQVAVNETANQTTWISDGLRLTSR